MALWAMTEGLQLERATVGDGVPEGRGNWEQDTREFGEKCPHC